jgi:hypothetical protein
MGRSEVVVVALGDHFNPCPLCIMLHWRRLGLKSGKTFWSFGLPLIPQIAAVSVPDKSFGYGQYIQF